MRELPFYTNSSYAHRRALELSARSRQSRPATFRGSSSSPAAPRLSRPRGSFRASTTPPAANAAGRRSRATSPTTERRWERWGSTASRRCSRRSSRSCPGPPRPQHQPLPPSRRRERGGVYRISPRRARAGPSRPAGADQVALVIMEPVENAGGTLHATRRLLRRRAPSLRPLRDPALRRRGDRRLWTSGASFGSGRFDIRPDPSPARRASRRPTRRSAQ